VNVKNRGQIKSSLFFSKDGCFLNLGSPTWARTRDLRINRKVGRLNTLINQ
jgi:hypothetical protein